MLFKIVLWNWSENWGVSASFLMSTQLPYRIRDVRMTMIAGELRRMRLGNVGCCLSILTNLQKEAAEQVLGF